MKLINGVIYCLHICGKGYIGQTFKDPWKKRIYRHLSDLRGNIHDNGYLQNMYNKYGESSLNYFLVVEGVASLQELNELEEHYIAILGWFNNPERGMNLHSGGLNRIPSKETRCKLSEKGRGRKRSPESVAKTALGNSKPLPTIIGPDGTRYENECGIAPFARKHGLHDGDLSRVISGKQAHTKGFHLEGIDPEVERLKRIAKMAESKRGKKRGPPSPEARAKMSAVQRGKKLSPEHIANSALARSKPVSGALIAPDGTKYQNVVGLRPFCREYDLNYSSMHRLINGKQSRHRGWVWKSEQ